MNFSLNIGKLKEGGKFLQPGIHEATFKGVSCQTLKSGKTGEEYSVMAITFDVEGFGEWTYNLFPPTNAERSESQYGTNPSQVEQFMIFIKHLLDTANPAVSKEIEEGKTTLTAPTFEKFVKLIQKYTNEFVDEVTKIKLVPQRNGFSSFTSFPGKVGKNGELYLATKFIGDDVTLTAAEMKAIENMRTAAPTKMKGTSVKGMVPEYEAEEDVDDKLPF